MKKILIALFVLTLMVGFTSAMWSEDGDENIGFGDDDKDVLGAPLDEVRVLQEWLNANDETDQLADWGYAPKTTQDITVGP